MLVPRRPLRRNKGVSIRHASATGALVVAVSLALAGCGVPARSLGASPSPSALISPSATDQVSPTPTTPAFPSAADQLTLQEVLAAWAGFPVNGSPRPLILLAGADQTMNSPGFAFPSGDDKLAFLLGQVHPPASWPTNPGEADGYPLITPAAAFAEFMPTPGTYDPPTTTWLDASSVQLGTATFTSDRGPYQLPAWEFTFGGVSGSQAVLAVAPASIYSVPAALSSPSGTALAGGAELGADGRTLTVDTGGWESGSGPCEAGYSLQVESSDTAVAIVVDEDFHPPPSPEGCSDTASITQLTTVLSAPLDARVVVNADAEAVEVTRDGSSS